MQPDLLALARDLDDLLVYDRHTTHRSLLSRIGLIGELREGGYDWALVLHAALYFPITIWGLYYWFHQHLSLRKVRQYEALEARYGRTIRQIFAAEGEAGFRDNGGPGERAEYHAGYFGAFVLDPDGNNVEAVFHDR